MDTQSWFYFKHEDSSDDDLKIVCSQRMALKTHMVNPCDVQHPPFTHGKRLGTIRHLKFTATALYEKVRLLR